MYVSASLGLFVYGCNWYYLTARWRHLRKRSLPPPPSRPVQAKVTVQLPVYDERYVARRLLDAVAAFDWPRDLLEIQVLDDSDDDTTEILAKAVARHRSQGLSVVHIRRGDREGFKAGALAHGFALAEGEFVAVFDCDFCPPPDFLLRVMGEFEDPRVGMVQTRWGHLNEEFSILTRAEALGVDGHFAIEQDVRHRLGYFMNFNGTAGVWRRACIEASGGWDDDTLAEDLDLSYRAQLLGWKFVYRKDVVCPAELPAQIHAWKRQQFRWAKGSIQVLKKLRPRIRRSGLTLGQRVQAYLHLSLYAVHPLMLLSFLLLPTLLVVGGLPPLVPGLFAAASLGPASMYAAAQWDLHRKDWKRRLLALPILTVLGAGLSLTNSRAVLEALVGRPSAFLRTPKFGLEGRSGSWKGSRYALRDTGEVVAEIALGLYGLAGGWLAFLSGNWWALPWILLFGAGFLGVAGLSLSHALAAGGAREDGARHAVPP